MITLQDWSVVDGGNDIWSAPETWTPRLHGKVNSHPRFDDGKEVTTSNIVSSDGREVTTASGSVYFLGDPSPEYVEWYRKTYNKELDQSNPIKVAKRN